MEEPTDRTDRLEHAGWVYQSDSQIRTESDSSSSLDDPTPPPHDYCFGRNQKLRQPSLFVVASPEKSFFVMTLSIQLATHSPCPHITQWCRAAAIHDCPPTSSVQPSQQSVRVYSVHANTPSGPDTGAGHSSTEPRRSVK